MTLFTANYIRRTPCIKRALEGVRLIPVSLYKTAAKYALKRLATVVSVMIYNKCYIRTVTHVLGSRPFQPSLSPVQKEVRYRLAYKRSFHGSTASHEVTHPS